MHAPCMMCSSMLSHELGHWHVCYQQLCYTPACCPTASPLSCTTQSVALIIHREACLLLKVLLCSSLMSVLQVLKQRLSVHEPSIMCGEFMYEEGEGLEDDEVAENAAHLSKRLEALPGK